MGKESQGHFTVAGTNINEVKRQNAQSGMSYNEMKKLLTKNADQGTATFSDTNAAQVRKDIQ